MEMIVHLHPEIFELVREGTKDVEVRVYDEKRRQLKVGDTLLFLKRPDDKEKIRVEVTNIALYSDFREVTYAYPMERIYMKDTTQDDYLALMGQFYKPEEVLENGVVALEFQILSEE